MVDDMTSCYLQSGINVQYRCLDHVPAFEVQISKGFSLRAMGLSIHSWHMRTGRLQHD